MKAIRTRFFGASNVKGSRVRASDGDGNSVTLGYDHSLNSDQMREKAARALCEKMGWKGAEGLPETFLDHCPFTDQGKRKAIGNGVPQAMGRALARAIRESV